MSDDAGWISMPVSEFEELHAQSRATIQLWQERLGDAQAALLVADATILERTADIRRLADERDVLRIGVRQAKEEIARLRRDLDLALLANASLVEGSELAEAEIARLRALIERDERQP